MNELSLIKKPPYNIKRIFAKLCITLAKKSLITRGIRLKLLKMGGVKIKGNSFIGSNITFDGIYPNLIEIGKGCVITSGTVILSHFYNTKDRKFYSGKVTIGENVFIGMNSIIVNAINIGDNSIIGAGSIVNKDIPDNEFWAGNPIRFIKRLN